MGIIEKIELDDATMAALRARARSAGRSIDVGVAELVRLGLGTVGKRTDLLARSQSLRASLPPQKTDSLILLREDRAR